MTCPFLNFSIKFTIESVHPKLAGALKFIWSKHPPAACHSPYANPILPGSRLNMEKRELLSDKIFYDSRQCHPILTFQTRNSGFVFNLSQSFIMYAPSAATLGCCYPVLRRQPSVVPPHASYFRACSCPHPFLSHLLFTAVVKRLSVRIIFCLKVTRFPSLWRSEVNYKVVQPQGAQLIQNGAVRRGALPQSPSPLAPVPQLSLLSVHMTSSNPLSHLI